MLSFHQLRNSQLNALRRKKEGFMFVSTSDAHRASLLQAQIALMKFRNAGDVSKYPVIREFVSRCGSQLPCDLSGWGTALILREDEYIRIREGFHRTREGQAELREWSSIVLRLIGCA